MTFLQENKVDNKESSSCRGQGGDGAEVNDKNPLTLLPGAAVLSRADSNDTQNSVPFVSAVVVESETDIPKREVPSFGEEIPHSPDTSDLTQPLNKRRWQIGTGIAILLFVSAGVAIGLALGLRSSSQASSPTSRPAYSASAAHGCFLDNDGVSNICYKEEGVATLLFYGCPSREGENVFDCQSCSVFLGISSVNDINEKSVDCSSCTLCVESETVAFDCSNMVPDNPCSIRDCDEQCSPAP